MTWEWMTTPVSVPVWLIITYGALLVVVGRAIVAGVKKEKKS